MFSLFDFAHVHEMQTVVLIIDSLGVEFGWVGLLRRNKQAVVDNVLETTMFRFLASVDTPKPKRTLVGTVLHLLWLSGVRGS